MADEIPILVPSPESYLASQALGISQALASTRTEISRLERLANKHPERSKELLEWAEALRCNASLFRALRDEVLPYCASTEICEVTARNQGHIEGCGLDEIGHALALARRDWGGEEACENEVLKLTEAIAKAIEASCRNPHSVLVLGSGMGRLTEELNRRYEQIYAVELLLPMELLRRKLHKQPVSFNIVDPRNRRRGSDMVKRVVITGQRGTNGSSGDFVVGDARQAPWPDSSFSCVVSAYFSDVIPFSVLLPEITRLLQPGGIFVHVGPLAYHHEEVGEYLGADQFVERLESCGYTVLRTDWIRISLRDDPTSMYSHACDNLVLTARKRENIKLSPQKLEMDAILGLQEGIILNTEVRLSNQSAKIQKAELKTGDGRSVALSPLATRMVEAIDGKTRFCDILKKLGSMLGTELLPEGELNKLNGIVAQLLELGALRLVALR